MSAPAQMIWSATSDDIMFILTSYPNPRDDALIYRNIRGRRWERRVVVDPAMSGWVKYRNIES